MISLYLLGNPDHYCSHKFQNCYWQGFVTKARSPFVKVTPKVDETAGNETDRVTVFKHGNCVIGLSPVLDYIWRPRELENLNLYDWLCNYVREKNRIHKTVQKMTHLDHTASCSDEKSSGEGETNPSQLLHFLPEHPLSASHNVCLQTLQDK
jgi:hypothetical protein